MQNWEDYKDIFEPFEKLIEVEICGKTYQVPENNELLRCFQFLAMENISMLNFAGMAIAPIVRFGWRLKQVKNPPCLVAQKSPKR